MPVARAALRMPMMIKIPTRRRAGFVSFKGYNSTIHMGNFSKTCAARRQYLSGWIAENPESEALLSGDQAVKVLIPAYPKSEIGSLYHRKSSITICNSRLWHRRKNAVPNRN
jgi:hypothetical protein